MQKQTVPVPKGEVLAHRGLWNEEVEPNSERALADALTCGFGLETDVRDHQGDLVVSHDPPVGDEPQLTDLVRHHRDPGALLALNVKADGLANGLLSVVHDNKMAPYFAFDMSYPQARLFVQSGLPIAARVSEFESPESSHIGPYAFARYLWVDCFESDWFLSDTNLGAALLDRVSILVSPEIHGRDPEAAWNWVWTTRQMGHRVGLCTDLPLEFEAWQASNRRA